MKYAELKKARRKIEAIAPTEETRAKLRQIENLIKRNPPTLAEVYSSIGE